MIENIFELVHYMENCNTDRLAFQWKDATTQTEKSISYAQFAKDIRCCVTKLKKEMGELRNRHIAVLAYNSYLYAVYFFAGMLAQTVFCPLNIQKTIPELEFEIGMAEVDLLLHDGRYFVDQPEFYKTIHCKTLLMEDVSSFEEDHSETEPDENALAMILFTSGTSGQSKGVMLNQKGIFSSIHNDFLQYSGSISNCDSEMIMLPFYHVGGLHRLFFNLLLRNRIVLCTEPKYFLTTLNSFPFDRCFMVPMVLKSFCRMLKRNQLSKTLSLKEIIAGASSVDPEMVRFLLQYGFSVVNYYGMTETFGCGTRNLRFISDHINSIGLLGPSIAAKIVDQELLLKGPSVMMGYYHDDELTNETIDSDGWLHTGDLVEVDTDGYYYIIGRKKNLIILSNGENVSPELLENRLSLNLNILEIVIKEIDDHICAEIFCEEKHQESIQSYITQVNSQLSFYQQITKIIFRKDAFPKTASGKIKRGELENEQGTDCLKNN